MFNFLQTTIKRKSCLFVYVFFRAISQNNTPVIYSRSLWMKKKVSFTSDDIYKLQDICYVFSTQNVQVACDTYGVVLSSLFENNPRFLQKIEKLYVIMNMIITCLSWKERGGLSCETTKTEAPCHSRCGTIKPPSAVKSESSNFSKGMG